MPPEFSLILVGYALMSLTTFGAFLLDKRAAVNGGWRTPERTLHLLELGGGFPGAIIAMVLLRHKNRKPSFVAVTVLIAAAHVSAWIALCM